MVSFRKFSGHNYGFFDWLLLLLKAYFIVVFGCKVFRSEFLEGSSKTVYKPGKIIKIHYINIVIELMVMFCNIHVHGRKLMSNNFLFNKTYVI